MKRTILVFTLALLVGGRPSEARGSEEGVQIFVPDGQMTSHPFRVFVEDHISKAMEPKLRIYKGYLIKGSHSEAPREFEPELVAPDQKLVQEVNGQKHRIDNSR